MEIVQSTFTLIAFAIVCTSLGACIGGLIGFFIGKYIRSIMMIVSSVEGE